MSIRNKLIALTAIMIAAMIALAIFATLMTNQFAGVAADLYDDAFVGVHYAHKVEVGFVRFEDAHRTLPEPYTTNADVQDIQTILDNLDIAIERAPTAHEKQLAQAARAQIAALDTSPQDLAAIDRDLTKLVQRFADRALDLRTSGDELLDRQKRIFGMVAGASLIAGFIGAVLLILQIVPPLLAVRKMAAGGSERIKENDPLVRRRDEIGDVARALFGAQQEVEQTLSTLEERVSLRTRELERSKEDAEAANVAKSTFLATMSHEIRTPLNGVLGIAQAMEKDDLSAPQRQRLEVIRQSGEALLAILNDILDLSKIEAGKLELEEIEFDLNDVVRGAHSTFTQLANSKGLSFSFTTQGAEGVYRGDPTRLRQILYNLFSNALKFTESGEIRMVLARDAKGVVLSVADTGIGMSPEVTDRLFSKFSQADASTTRRFGGSGMGLAICRELAERMGGSIEVESDLGVGAKFTVHLAIPRVRATSGVIERAPEPDELALSAGADAGLRVLAAEDNSVNQLVLKTLLQQVGVNPTFVDNGAQAVAAWRQGEFDIVLMDVQMPEMDGPSATQAIRKLELEMGRERTPIIALTANVMPHQVAHYREIGMDGCVAKPIHIGLLLTAMNEALVDRGADENQNAA